MSSGSLSWTEVIVILVIILVAGGIRLAVGRWSLRQLRGARQRSPGFLRGLLYVGLSVAVGAGAIALMRLGLLTSSQVDALLGVLSGLWWLVVIGGVIAWLYKRGTD